MKITSEMLENAKKIENLEELVALAKEKEIDATEERIKEFYETNHKSGELNDNELDNESLITAVESSPTHKRMAKDLQQIKNISSEAKKAIEHEYEQPSEDNVTIEMNVEDTPTNDENVEISY